MFFLLIFIFLSRQVNALLIEFAASFMNKIITFLH